MTISQSMALYKMFPNEWRRKNDPSNRIKLILSLTDIMYLLGTRCCWLVGDGLEKEGGSLERFQK